MPQPYRHTGHIFLHPESLLKRPRIAVLIAEYVAAHARGVVAQGNVLSAILSVGEDVGLDLYLTLIADGAKKNVFDRLTRQRLTPDQQKNLEGLLAQFRSAGAWRNDFVHHVWATASDEPHNILLVEPSEAIRWMRKSRVHVTPAPKAMVYTEIEIGTQMEKLSDAARDLNLFALALTPPTPARRPEK